MTTENHPGRTTMSDVIASDQLRLLIERIERLEEEKKGIADDIKDVYGEAKSTGFDVKTIRAIIQLRKMDVNSRREAEALLDTYKAALGMLDGTPLGRWAVERLHPVDDAPTDASSTDDEELYTAAVKLVTDNANASTSWLQRQLRVGYNQATRLIERMEREGLVTKPDHVGRRELAGATAEHVPTPEPTADDARKMGTEAARAGAPVTSNPFPARDVRRAAWDEAWCSELGSDGMDIPDAWKPKKAEKAEQPAGAE
jgi:uncharacterized protein (UPF0335 family)